MKSLDNLKTWFENNGVVHETSTGTWVKGYLEDIHSLLQDEVERAEQRGYKKRGRELDKPKRRKTT